MNHYKLSKKIYKNKIKTFLLNTFYNFIKI